MIKSSPGIGRILVMVGFALSCFGILIFLWLSFGGPVPLQPKGYRVDVGFPQATQLAQQADVRISGVHVGTVKNVEANPKTGLTDAVLEIDSRFAPIPRDTRAILRQKTLLGETYVELSPGRRSSGQLADGGTLPQGQVAETVQLDQVLSTFDPETRRKFAIWMDQQGRAVEHNGPSINATLAALTPFAESTDKVLKVVRAQSGETSRFVRDTGVVFDALTERRGQLRDLIVNSNRVFETTAARDTDLAETFHILPTFLREGRQTTERLTRFAANTNPLVTQLRPAARQLSPTLENLEALAPDLRGLLTDLNPLVKAGNKGLPATEQVFDNTRPLLARLGPFLRDFTPIVDYLGLYKREVAGFLANDVASTQATGTDFAGTGSLHYLRTTNPTNPEMLAAYPYRIGSNRTNPYTRPGGYDQLKDNGRLDVFGTYLCTDNPVPGPPAPTPQLPADMVELIKRFVYGGPENAGARPPCVGQAPLGNVVGQSGLFPALQPLPGQ
jgi:virulence factor Mce-like protein